MVHTTNNSKTSNMFDIDRLSFVVCSTKKIKLCNNSTNKELLRRQQKGTTTNGSRGSHKTYLTTAARGLFSIHSMTKCDEFMVDMHYRGENSRQGSSTRWLSSSGQNYLHLLCQCCPSVDTVRSLLELDPNAIKEADANGCLPIHVAMTNGASHSVLSILIETYPYGVKMKNKWGYTAFDWIVNRCLYELSSTDSSILKCSHQEIWQTLKVLIMAKATNGKTARWSNKNILQMTFEFQCPLALTKVILSEFPYMAESKDDQGHIPLATALNAHSSKMVPLETVKMLVMANPKMLLERDHDGRIPFHIAIDTKRDWSLLKFMLKYEPDCMRCYDSLTGLYPFMLLSTKEYVSLSDLFEAISFCVDMFNELAT
mmetsp:Transcript_1578/g.2885  ORF Transcript_1578/g.2885 Transcript_1578/m.2885 type:complete len:371 (+) Transcript_1578:58-1170(+)